MILIKIPGIHVHFSKSIQTDKENVNSLLFSGLLLRYASEIKDDSLFNELKVCLILNKHNRNIKKLIFNL